MIKLFIFDIGDVLLLGSRSLRDMANELGINEEEFVSDYRRWNAALMDGYVSTSDYYKHLENKFCVRITSDLFVENYNPVVNKQLLDYIKELRAKGLKAVLGSNTFTCYDKWILKNIPEFYDLFDNKYLSCDIKRSKPEKSFFSYILNNENVKPEETVFIDDREENITAAKSIGINAFRYESVEELKNDIDRNLWKHLI